MSDALRNSLKHLMSLSEHAWKDCDVIKDHIAALEKERDAAIADNAALMMLVADVVGCIHTTHLDMGGQHRFSVRNGPAAVKAIGAALALKPIDHPGAALLEEHRKALVRARNEGREAAAAFADEYQRLIKGLDAFGPKAELAVAAVAAGIRHRKEPESD